MKIAFKIFLALYGGIVFAQPQAVPKAALEIFDNDLAGAEKYAAYVAAKYPLHAAIKEPSYNKGIRFYSDYWYINHEIRINDELFCVKCDGCFGFNIDENGAIIDEFIFQPMCVYPKTINHLGGIKDQYIKTIRQNGNTFSLVYNLEPVKLEFRDKAKLLKEEQLEGGSIRKTFEVYCRLSAVSKLCILKDGEIKLDKLSVYGHDFIEKIPVNNNGSFRGDFKHLLCPLTAEAVDLQGSKDIKKCGEIRIVSSIICEKS